MAIKFMIGCFDESAWHLMREALEREDPAIDCLLADLEHLPASAAAIQPDVLFVERSGGGECTRLMISTIGQVSPCTRTLMICQACTHDLVIESIKHGACGCLLKSSSASLFAKAVRAVHRGETWYGRTALLQALCSQLCSSPRAEPGEDEKLTRREQEILRLIGSGLTNKEIGRRLEISDHTVKTHLHRVYVKLHQSGRYKAFLTQPEEPAMRGSMTLFDQVQPILRPSAGRQAHDG